MEQILGDSIMNHEFISNWEDAKFNQEIKAKATETKIFASKLHEAIKSFWKRSELQILIYSLIAARYLPKDYRQLCMTVFRVFDKFNWGKITEHELCEGFNIFYLWKLNPDDLKIIQEAIDIDHTKYITPQRFIMMSLSKDMVTKYLPYIWDKLTSGSDILGVITFRKKVLNNNENFSDYVFLEEELKGKLTIGLTYDEFITLILGNSKR